MKILIISFLKIINFLIDDLVNVNNHERILKSLFPFSQRNQLKDKSDYVYFFHVYFITKFSNFKNVRPFGFTKYILPLFRNFSAWLHEYYCCNIFVFDIKII